MSNIFNKVEAWQGMQAQSKKLFAALCGTTALCAVPTLGQAQSTGAESAGGQDGVMLEEILVTATRRVERLSRIPVSVAAFSQENLDTRSIRSQSDLAILTPGLNFRPNIGSSSSIDIRGIASLAGSATTGVYIDDTPIQARTLGFFTQNAYPVTFDLERIEVLRGPQGTLFGAGSQGGTVRFITPKPNLERVTIYGRTELSDFTGGGSSYEAGAGVSVPLIQDKLAVRTSAYYRRDGGFVDRVDFFSGQRVEEDFNTADTISFKGSIAYAPNDTVRITPSIYYQRREFDGTESYWTNLSDLDNNDFVTGDPIGQAGRDRFILPAVEIDVDLGWANVVSSTSYFDRKFAADVDFSTVLPVVVGQASGLDPLPFFGFEDRTFLNFERNRQKNFTQEIRISAPDSEARFNWLVGVFFNRSEQNQFQAFEGDNAEFVFRDIIGVPDFLPIPPNVQPGNFLLFAANDSIDTQYAVFGNLEFKLTERIELVAGARVAHVKNEFANDQSGPLNFGDVQSQATQKATPINPKFGVNFQADEDNLFYVSAAKGFRIGGGNAPVLGVCETDLNTIGLESAPETYGSDTLWSYEIGAKNRLFGGRLQLDTSAYQINWKNIQQQVFLTLCNFQYVENLGEARSRGFDLQANFQVTDELMLGTTIGYTRAKYTEDVFPGPIEGTGPNSVIVSDGDEVGNGSSPWTLIFTGQYNREVFRDTNFYATADFIYNSNNPGRTAFLNPSSISFFPDYPTIPSSTIVNARVGIQRGNFDVSLFVQNATNSQSETYFFKDSPASPYFKNVSQRPRVVGFTATYRQ